MFLKFSVVSKVQWIKVYQEELLDKFAIHGNFRGKGGESPQ